jgi:eukaryotic-like serine/threonine-protein kinase
MNEQDIYIEAMNLEGAAERLSFLDQACGENSVLRARLEKLIQHSVRVGSFLELPPEPLRVMDEAAIGAEVVGTQIGPYRIREQIGEGGFGVVFLAEQEWPVRRRVALKVIKPGMDTREVVARFDAERQALAMMDHSYIAKVHDAGATENGRPYFVMELVQGVPITEYCDQCNLKTVERLTLFVMVCQAVQHAHQKGVIHRDIKPTNVLVAIQDGRPAPKIIDFGVAKAINQQLTERTLMTGFAQIVGTPLYMSPEQAELSPLGVDTRSDIYSLGVLLYELLTGTTPCDKDRLHAASYDELRRVIREEEPPRPSARISTLAADLATTVAENRRTDMRRLQQTVRGELDWIVMKCLEKDRNRRYDSVGSLTRDIERYLHDEPVQACPPSASYRFRKFARRNKGPLAAGLAIAAALVAGLGLSTWLYVRERTAVQVAKANEARATTESNRAKAVSNFLQEMIGSADTGHGRGIDYTVRELLDDFSGHLGNQLSEQPEVEADVHAMIGRAYRSLRLPNEAQPHYEKAVELRRRLVGPKREELAATLVEFGLNLSAQAKFVEAENSIREAIEIYRRQGDSGVPLIRALEGLQFVLASSHRDTEAEAVMREALSVAGRGPEETAAAGLPQSIEMLRRLPGASTPQIAYALRGLGVVLYSQQKFKEAESVLTESLEIFRRYYPEDHFDIRVIVSDLDAIFEARGDEMAIKRLASEVDERTRRSDGPDYHVRLAGLLLTASPPTDARWKEARRLIRRAIVEYGQIEADSPKNLDRRLKAVQGYADVAALCTTDAGLAKQRDEVTHRLNAAFPKLLCAFPDRDATINIAYIFALVRLRLGDNEGYREACSVLADLPDGVENYKAEYRRIWTWCLGPDALGDLSVARRQVTDIAAKYPQVLDHRLALGGIFYRAGEYERAAEILQTTNSPYSSDWSGESMVVNSQLLLAMTKWQLGEKELARQILAEIQPAVGEAIERWQSEWIYRTTVEVLDREADGLIDKKSAANKDVQKDSFIEDPSKQ